MTRLYSAFPARLALSALFASLIVCTSYAVDTATNQPSIASKIKLAQKNTTEAREAIGQLRNEASALSKPAASQAELQQALAKIKLALSSIESTDAKDLMSDANHFHGRRFDYLFDAALIELRLGNKEAFFNFLESTQHWVLIPAIKKYLSTPSFASIKDEPRLQAYLKASELPAKMGRASVLATGYQDNISNAEKVAGLSLFWSEARRSFVHFQHVPDLDWDRLYLDYLGKVMQTTSTREYYQLMMQLAPLLQDGHTNIYAPDELSDQFYSRPALETALIGQTVLITRVGNQQLAKRIKRGEEITSIDGQPVHEYALNKVAPYASSSTPQDKAVRTYGYGLLMGDKSQSIRLGLRDAAGKERVETVVRGEATDVAGNPAFDFKMLKGEIAYLAIDHFESDAGARKLASLMPTVMKAKGLILDIRSNGGGSSMHAAAVLSLLSKQPVPFADSTERQESNLMRAQSDVIFLGVLRGGLTQPYVKEHQDIYSGTVVVLAGPKTFSAAEDFLLSYITMQRGRIIGSATGGSTGMPLSFKLPGGGSARICVKHDSFPDGREFVGKGIAPDIEIAPTVDDIRAGRDVVLDKALAVLSK
ncbi:S41 family peptidase [Undibacterium sp. JH2W]|uniref:S41 family peptidase n=1 Tax=Undibacterium sp. JH2W TaxID=3413037 RepID=UPI003BEF6EB3